MPFSGSRAIRWLAIAAILFVSQMLVPAPPVPMGYGLETGWMFGLNLAHDAGLVFGRDVQFTYGPLGWLIYPSFPHANLDAHAMACYGYAVAFGLLLWMLFRRLGESVWALIAVLLVALPAVLGFRHLVQSLELLLVVAGLIAMGNRVSPKWEFAAMSLMTAVGMLTKFTHFLIGVAMMGAIWVVFAWREKNRKESAILAAITAASLPIGFLLYLATGGEAGSFGQYVAASLELTSGYSESMSVSGPLAIFVLGWVSALAMLSLPFLTSEFKSLAWGFLPAIPYAFMAIRYAMTRQDVHSDPLWTRLALAAMFFAVLAQESVSRKLIGAFCVVASLISFGFFAQSNPYAAAGVISQFSGASTRLWIAKYAEKSKELMILRDTTSLMLQPARLPAGIRKAIGERSVEIWPWEIAAAVVDRLYWKPRPIFQAYSAYTPKLDAWNAEFLERQGAERIALHSGAIDYRAQFWEDPAQTLALLNRYRPVSREGEYVLLERTTQPRISSPKTIWKRRVSQNEAIEIPKLQAGQLLTLRIDIGLGLQGKIYSQIVRTPPLILRVRLSTGREVKARAIFRSLIAGIVVGVYPEDLDAYLAWNSQPDGRATIEKIWVESPTPSAFAQEFEVELQEHTIQQDRLGPEPKRGAEFRILSDTKTQTVAGIGAVSVALAGDRSPNVISARVRCNQPGALALSFGNHDGAHRLNTELPPKDEWRRYYFQVGRHPLWAKERGSLFQLEFRTADPAQCEVSELAEVEISPDPLLQISIRR